MNIEVRSSDDTTTLKLLGPLDAVGVIDQGPVLQTEIERGRDVVLDMEDASFLDPAGVCLLVDAQRRLRSRRLGFSVVNAHGQPRALLAQLGLESALNVSALVGDARPAPVEAAIELGVA